MSDQDLSPLVGVGTPTPVGGSPGQSTSMPRTTARPYVRVEVCSSIVPSSRTASGRAKSDEGRWFCFAAGCGLDRETEDFLGGESAVLQGESNGSKISFGGPSGIGRVQIRHTLQGLQASVSFRGTDISLRLARLVRPMDRLRVVLIHPLVEAEDHQWTIFDGLLDSCRAGVRGGSSYVASLTLQATGGVRAILSGGTYNWQGFLHADSDLVRSSAGKTLYEKIGREARPPQDVIRAFIESAIKTSMSLRVGDWREEGGLDMLSYVGFSSGFWRGLPGALFPLPYSLIQSQSGLSFWRIAEGLAEPQLHEVFETLESPSPGELERPVLVHRPIPFPGRAALDGIGWESLEVYEITRDRALPTQWEETLTGEVHPNVFHWNGAGVMDNSSAYQLHRNAIGFLSSNDLINRFGYHSQDFSSRMGPLAPGKGAADYVSWIQDALEHYGRQQAPLALLRNLRLTAPFYPVRPGMVLVDSSAGDDVSTKVTGYVTGTDFMLEGSADSFSMSMTVEVARAIRGVDAEGYPDAYRDLASDLSRKPYAGKGLGDLPPPPATSATYKPPKKEEAKRGDAGQFAEAIHGAASEYGFEPWVIAHLLHNETAMGRNMAGSKKGIAQLTDIAVWELVANSHVNPDGSIFSANDRGDPTKCIYAAAHLLKLSKAALRFPTGWTASEDNPAESWWLRAYRWGAASTNVFGSSNGWRWPSTGEAYPDYRRYWSPAGVKRGKAFWAGV